MFNRVKLCTHALLSEPVFASRHVHAFNRSSDHVQINILCKILCIPPDGTKNVDLHATTANTSMKITNKKYQQAQRGRYGTQPNEGVTRLYSSGFSLLSCLCGHNSFRLLAPAAEVESWVESSEQILSLAARRHF